MFLVIQVDEPEEELICLCKLKNMQLNFLKPRGHMEAKCDLISSGLKAPSSSTQQLYLIPSVSVGFLEKKNMLENANILINLRGKTNENQTMTLVTVLLPS